jgi:ribosomal protein S12 methylthiotransferase accessory factor
VFVAEPADPRLPQAVGSGFDADSARRAVRGERIERYSQLFRGDEPRIQSTLRRLGSRAFHPNECLLFSARQYRERRRWNARRQPACFVPRPFDARCLTHWTAVRSLTHDAERFVPTGILYYEAIVAGGDAFVSDSIGSASGETFEDAVVRGFLEVVERDAIALWWYHRRRCRAIDSAAFGDAKLDRLRSEIAKAGLTLELLDLMSDLQLPVIAAVARPWPTHGHVAIGFGSHFDAKLAARRAAAEMVQSLALRRSIDDALFVRASSVGPVPATAWRGSDGLQLSVAIARTQGLELLVADLTRPDVGVPVVKVLVPGMRPATPRFAPGRLYDVPRRQGLRVSESGLNPLPFIL